jgi:hypothetical protein
MLKAKRVICTELIPICCNCKKIRDENGNWESSDAYFTPNIDAKFTHGICSECAKRLYPNLKF